MKLTAAMLLASLAVGTGVCNSSPQSAAPTAHSGVIARVAARLAKPASDAEVSAPGALPADIDLTDKGLPAPKAMAPRRAPRNALAAAEAPKPAPRPRPKQVEAPTPVPEPVLQPRPAPEPADFSELARGGTADPTPTPAPARASAPVVAARPMAPFATRPSVGEDGWRPSTPVIIASSVGAIGLTLGAMGAGFGDGGGDVGFAVAGAGIGVIGLATAGILLLLESGDHDEPKQVRVAVGPTAVAVRGGF